MLTTLLTTAALLLTVHAAGKTVNPALNQAIKMAPTNLDMNAPLGYNASAWTYDFTEHPYYNFAPGGVVKAGECNTIAAEACRASSLEIRRCRMTFQAFRMRCMIRWRV
jgi:hypothetical protein